MAKIAIHLDHTIEDGEQITLRAPCNSGSASLLKVYYPQSPSGVETYQEFTMKDAAGNTLSGAAGLFVTGAYLTMALDTTNSYAYIHNAVDIPREPARLSGIAVTAMPSKISYAINDTLNLSGIVITATYTDGSTENVTSSCTFSPANGATLATAGTTVVTATYTEGGVQKTATFEVTVYPAPSSYDLSAEWNPYTLTLDIQEENSQTQENQSHSWIAGESTLVINGELGNAVIQYSSSEGNTPGDRFVTMDDQGQYTLTAADLPDLGTLPGGPGEEYVFMFWYENLDPLQPGDIVTFDPETRTVTLYAYWELNTWSE